MFGSVIIGGCVHAVGHSTNGQTVVAYHCDCICPGLHNPLIECDRTLSVAAAFPSLRL